MQRRWTNEEIEYLEVSYNRLPIKQIVEELNRTHNSITSKAQSLNLMKSHRSNKHLDEYAVYKGDDMLFTGTIKEISDELNIQPNTLYRYSSLSYKRMIEREGRNNLIVLVNLDD